MKEFHWADPVWFSLFLIWGLLLAAIWYKAKPAAISYSSVQWLNVLPASWRVKWRGLPLAIRLLALSLLTLALARPQWGNKSTERLTDGVDIVLAVDTSRSMDSLDFKLNGKRQNRLEVAKTVISDFIQQREEDRVGLVVFGEEAYTQCPLTHDHGVLLSFLEQTQIGMAGDATAIGSAIGIAIQRLKDLKAKSKVIILITDGVSNAGNLDPLTAAKIAADNGIKVYTIGAGTNGEAPIMIDTPLGKRLEYIPVEIDERTMQEVSRLTGGQYFRATDTASLQNIYQQINQLEKTEVKVKEYFNYEEHYFVFVVSALILLLIEFVLQGTVWRTVL